MREDLLKGLTDEQIAKVKACKNQEEVLKLAKEQGIELPSEQLAAVSGGGLCRSTPSFTCPKCGSSKVKSKYYENSINTWYGNDCQECGFHWNVDA